MALRNPTLLRFENLGRRYGAHWALENASGRLDAGEIVALEGANGSGKSTLLLTLAGILKPHRGTVKMDIGICSHLVAHHTMAYGELSIRDNLALASALRFRESRGFDETLAYWGVENLAAKNLATLSRGQMQRFLLARAMLAAPQVLLLDEPFTGLDVRGEALLTQFIKSAAAEGAAVLFADHNAARAAKLSARQFTMDAGTMR